MRFKVKKTGDRLGIPTRTIPTTKVMTEEEACKIIHSARDLGWHEVVEVIKAAPQEGHPSSNPMWDKVLCSCGKQEVRTLLEVAGHANPNYVINNDDWMVMYKWATEQVWWLNFLFNQLDGRWKFNDESYSYNAAYAEGLSQGALELTELIAKPHLFAYTLALYLK